MNYSIDGFWKTRLAGVVRQMTALPMAGWTFNSTADDSYVPAELKLRDGFDDLSQPVWLIGAPGAVGKSTLAKEICAATGAIYLDLALAKTVAGNYMVGGLVYTQALSAWTGGSAAILVDALDEARLRVTQSGFEAFLEDVADVAALGKFPVIVLGRVGIIEEAWMILNEKKRFEPPIFDIELFGPTEAEQFVWARLLKLSAQKRAGARETLEYPELARSLDEHASTYKAAITQVVTGLQKLSAQDGNRFVGYAPVLDAVAKVIASETNPARISEEMQRVLEGKVLNSLAKEILLREKSKLVTQLRAAMPDMPGGLYEPAEQLERLGATLFGRKQPPMPKSLAPQQIAIYERAVMGLLPQHPFLDGGGRAPSSAVFAACVLADTLKRGTGELARAAEAYASSGQHTPNPFLYDFYEPGASVPTEHVGLIFESVLAKSKPGETVRLSIEGELDAASISVEVSIEQDGSVARTEFEAPSAGLLRLGRRVAGISIDVEATDVELGTGDQLELVAPVFISARKLQLACNQIVVRGDSTVIEDGTVILESEEVEADPSLSTPLVRHGARLQVSWPNATSYPWTTFSAPAAQNENPKTADALRALRRLTLAFRSHSKGQLARYKGKIEHQRMMKGDTGRAVLKQLMEDEVVSLKGPMYFLDPDALGAKVGAAFVDIKLKRFSDKTREYVQRVISQ